MATKGKSKVGQKNRKAAVMAGPAAPAGRARTRSVVARRKAGPTARRLASTPATKAPPRRAAVIRQPSMSERSYAIAPKPVA